MKKIKRLFEQEGSNDPISIFLTRLNITDMEEEFQDFLNSVDELKYKLNSKDISFEEFEEQYISLLKIIKSKIDWIVD